MAVDHLSFHVAAGEVYGLLGPNGAGKTTTLWMVLGVLKPTSGYAEVDGYRSTDVPDAVKARLGLVSASAGVYPWLTPRETLLFFADLYHVPPMRRWNPSRRSVKSWACTRSSTSVARRSARARSSASIWPGLDPRSPDHVAGRTDSRAWTCGAAR